jgi:hypothetical protein
MPFLIDYPEHLLLHLTEVCGDFLKGLLLLQSFVFDRRSVEYLTYYNFGLIRIISRLETI